MSLQHSVDEKGTDDKATVGFCDSFLISKQQYKSCYLELEKGFVQCISMFL